MGEPLRLKCTECDCTKFIYCMRSNLICTGCGTMYDKPPIDKAAYDDVFDKNKLLEV